MVNFELPVAVKALMKVGRQHVLALQMRRGAVANQTVNRRPQQAVFAVRPAALLGNCFDGLGRGAPKQFAGYFQLADGQLVIDPRQKMRAAFPVILR